MASLSVIGPEREAVEAHIKDTAAALAARFEVANPIAGLELRTRLYDDPRLTMASASLVDRQLLAGLLDLFVACLNTVMIEEEDEPAPLG